MIEWLLLFAAVLFIAWLVRKSQDGAAGRAEQMPQTPPVERAPDPVAIPTAPHRELGRRESVAAAPAEETPKVRPRRARRRQSQPEIQPDSILAFVDTETTGLGRSHRIVTLAIVMMNTSDLLGNRVGARTTHLIFNPDRSCDPGATAIHGWHDQVLARQPRFRAHADDVADRLASANVWLMHNRSFDRGFLEREFEFLGRPFPDRPTYCTMRQARIQWPGQSARLDACAGRIGLGRSGQRHGALEDALLTAALFSFYHTGRRWKRLPEAGPPTNLVQ